MKESFERWPAKKERMSLMNLKTKKQGGIYTRRKKRPVRQAIKQPIITVEKMDVEII